LTETNIKDIVYETKKLNLWYGQTHALKNVDTVILKNEVTAVIGPSGCGKSTFIKVLNRMVELIPSVKTSGEVLYHGLDIFDRSVHAEELRSRVGMVFQKPNPFPKSIFENVVYGPRIHGIHDKKLLAEIAESSLVKAAIWDEVKDRLGDNAYSLSGGQQQRLCIARCLAIQPDVLLMDEPTSALDPISTQNVEDLIYELKQNYTIVIVTHNMQQAARISDKTAFFLLGELLETGSTEMIFNKPKNIKTEQYVTGRFG
jgi:phosphate transport system ATP-binding protein